MIFIGAARLAVAARGLLWAAVLFPALGAAPFVCTFTDRGGKPLRNVEVRLSIVGREDASEFPPLYRKSDREGAVEFPELLPGEYILEAQLRNFVPARQSLTAGVDQALSRILLREREFKRIEQKASQDLDDSEYLDAIRGIGELVEFYPEDAMLHDTLARAYAGLDDEAKALEEARLAARLDPGRFAGADLRVRRMLLGNRGEQALQQFDLGGAVEAFETLRELAPEDALAHEGLALAYGHLGRLEEALRAIRTAIELDPDNPKLSEILDVLEGAGAGP